MVNFFVFGFAGFVAWIGSPTARRFGLRAKLNAAGARPVGAEACKCLRIGEKSFVGGCDSLHGPGPGLVRTACAGSDLFAGVQLDRSSELKQSRTPRSWACSSRRPPARPSLMSGLLRPVREVTRLGRAVRTRKSQSWRLLGRRSRVGWEEREAPLEVLGNFDHVALASPVAPESFFRCGRR